MCARVLDAAAEEVLTGQVTNWRPCSVRRKLIGYVEVRARAR